MILRNNNQQDPSSFMNDFQNTFTIPANSEVALHSVALNRLNKFDVSAAVFYVYHGPALDATGVPVSGGNEELALPFEISLVDGSYTPVELAAHVQQQLRLQDFHPNYQQKWTCTAQITDGVYTGMLIECGQVAPATGAGVTEPLGIVNAGDNPSTFTYSSTGANAGKVTKTSTDITDRLYARSTRPMNLNGGEFVIDITGLHDLSPGGIISPNNGVGIGRDYLPADYYDQGEFFDTWVYIDDGSINAADKGNVHLLNDLWDSSQARFLGNTVTYWNSGDPDSAFKALAAPMNLINKPAGHTGTYNAIKFKFLNEQVTVSIGDCTAPTWEVLCKTTIKPVSISNCALYPKVFIADANDYCKFVHQDSVDDYYSPSAGTADIELISKNWPLVAVIEEVDQRVALNQPWVARGVTASVGNQTHLSYDAALVLGYQDPNTFYKVGDANVGGMLGYIGSITKAVTPAAAASNSSFAPTAGYVSKTAGDDVTFIRCPTLTQRSLNGDTKSLSSILCDVPRYTQNNTSGRVFYSPPEKTYLKLHNKEPLVLNRLSIDVVNSNERLVNDLTGDTTVILHIKSP